MVHIFINLLIPQLHQGDVVILDKGTYRGAPWSCGAVIATPNITVRGAGAGKTIINCSGAGIHTSNRSVYTMLFDVY
jgi:hypothetical protein